MGEYTDLYTELYNAIENIEQRIVSNVGDDNTWIGQNYSKANLLHDLKEALKR